MYHYCVNCFAIIGADGMCPRCGFENAAHEAEPHHLPPETILHGRYLVGRAMGEGGFGITYAGYDMVLERKIAVKEYFPSGTVWRDPATSLQVNCNTSQNCREAFEIGRQKCMREAKSLAKLDDIPAIVRILDFFPDNNTVYLIMEFVEGSTLKEYVDRLPRKLTLPNILYLLRPVTDALEKVHSRGFVHRDISPDNIMVTHDGTAKLLDFGAVKSVSGGGSATENPVVKRGFSPMELYSTTGLIGIWTDVYSLAAVIAYLLTGTVPEEPTDRMMDDHLPQALDGTCAEAQKSALLRALSIRPQLRPQSVAELVRDLTGAPPPTSVPMPVPKPVTQFPETIPLPKKPAVLENNLTAGREIVFGRYEQDNNLFNGPEPIEWIVLDQQNGKALLISKYALDCKQFNASYANVTWEICTLRQWLNETFLYIAFTADEQRRILTTTVTADNNPGYKTAPGSDTSDKVFLLSISEANNYFKTDTARRCAPTAYAAAQGVWMNTEEYTYRKEKACWWWLRSPGSSSNCAARVSCDGSVRANGYFVDYIYDAVRPAIWIEVN